MDKNKKGLVNVIGTGLFREIVLPGIKGQFEDALRKYIHASSGEIIERILGEITSDIEILIEEIGGEKVEIKVVIEDRRTEAP